MNTVKKTREIANTLEKGKVRYHLYKDLINRYSEAMKGGFFLEAITLMESLISDRLESALIYYGICTPDEVFKPLGENLKRLDNLGIISDELYDEINRWKKSRNALHEMAKISVGERPTFIARYENQKPIAEQGYAIFKKIKNELR